MNEALNLTHGDPDSLTYDHEEIQKLLLRRIGQQVIVIFRSKAIITVKGHLHGLGSLGEVFRVYGNGDDWQGSGARFRVEDVDHVYDGEFEAVLRIVLK